MLRRILARIAFALLSPIAPLLACEIVNHLDS